MIRTTKLRTYLKLAQRHDISARRLLAGTGISVRAAADPGALIELEQHDAVVSNLMRLVNRSDVAFAAGEAFDFADMGIVGYALLSSRNMRDALRIWSEYSSTLIGSPLRLVVGEPGGSAWDLTIASFARGTALQRFYIEEFLVTGIRLFRMLASQPPSIRAMSFTYARPPHHALYDKWFACRLSFDSPRTVFSVRAPGLDAPIRTNDEELNQAVSQHCRQILQQLPRSSGVAPRLRSLFLTEAHQLPDVANASLQLGLSQRTLRRRLQTSGQNYRQMKQDFRVQLARQYLESAELSLKEVAHLLGYVGPSAFCRAFRAWTGQTPGQYRGTAR